LWAVYARFALCDYDDGLVFAERINQLDGTLASHGER